MEDNAILEPLKEWSTLKDKCHQNAIEYYNEMVKKSAIDEKANNSTCDEYNAAYAAYQKALKKVGSATVIKVLLIILDVLVFIAALVMIILAFVVEGMMTVGLIVGICLVLLGAGIIVFLCLKIQKLLENRRLKAEKLKEKVDKLFATANAQMAPLNALFDWGMMAEVIEKTTPLIQMDKNFDVEKFQYLHEHYGLTDNNNPKESTAFVQSGSIKGNPFIVVRQNHQIDSQKTYTGSITISWTTHGTDSQGHSTTISHSQTLTASETKFYPVYNYDTFLVYANDAAPDLHFSRTPQVEKGTDDNKIKRMVKKGSKELDKLEKKELMDNDASTNFTSMGNDEFDVLFHAVDRDNEVQFRLLFTVLAQRNMVDLIKSDEPYGDDFNFTKIKKLNYIQSKHSQREDIYGNPTKFFSHDCRLSRNSFVDYCDKYFQCLYFDLAPVISIPLYQMNKPREYIYNEPITSNLTSYEMETLANSFDENMVKPATCTTCTIKKTQFLSKEGDTDKALLTSYGFRGERRVTNHSVMGGDGRMHVIPVSWVEYIPVKRELMMKAKNASETKKTFSEKVNSYASALGSDTLSYQRKLVAALSEYTSNN
ncbi:MAG: hypothetical protein WCR67_00075 [Bacilli bacterium]